MTSFAAWAGGSPQEGAAWLERAAAAMAAWCPDGGATWSGEEAGLTRALLRVQPTDDADEGLVDVGDGATLVGDVRLDDRTTLVRALQGAGRDVTADRPDSELVLHAWHAWGEACLDRLAGDFAWAIWDAGTRRLTCARDQLGVGQAYVARVGDAVLVASAIDVLRLHPGVPDDLDEQSIVDFLAMGMTSDVERTAYAAIRRLAPAHVLRYEDGRVTQRRWWSLPPTGDLLRLPRMEDYAERFRATLADAVRDRLPAGRVSAHLSGGMDSTAVTAVAHEILRGQAEPERLLALTMGTGDDDPEVVLARELAARHGIRHHVERLDAPPSLDPDIAPLLRTAEPRKATTSAHLRFGAVEQAHGRAVLTGLGGDPLMMFVPSWWIEALLRGDVRRVGRVWREHERLVGHRPPLFFKPALRWRRGRRPDAPVPAAAWIDPHVLGRTGGVERLAAARLVPRDNLGIVGVAGVVGTWSDVFASQDPGFAGVMLRHRHPLLDLRLVRLCLRLPPVPFFPYKRLLRDATRDLLPASVADRPKTPLGSRVEAARPASDLSPAELRRRLEAEPALSAYVRVGQLPDDPASFAPAVALHGWLRHRGAPIHRRPA